MEYLKDWRTWAGIIGIVLALAEIGRVLFNHIQQRENSKQQSKDYKASLAHQKMNAYEYDYSGKVFMKAKNKFQADKLFKTFKNQQKLLSETLQKKKENSKK